MSESSDRRNDAAAEDRSEFTVTSFGRRRQRGDRWTWRRAGWLALWPFLYFARRKYRRGRFPESRR